MLEPAGGQRYKQHNGWAAVNRPMGRPRSNNRAGLSQPSRAGLGRHTLSRASGLSDRINDIAVPQGKCWPPSKGMRGLSDQTLRIVHLGKYYPPAPGGMEAHVQTLARAQVALGASVSVVCVNHGAKNHQVSSASGAGRTETVQEQDGAGGGDTRRAAAARWRDWTFCPTLLRRVNAPAKKARRRYRTRADAEPYDAYGGAKGRNTAAGIPLVITHQSDIIKTQKVLKYGVRPFEHVVYRRAAKGTLQQSLLSGGVRSSAGLQRKDGRAATGDRPAAIPVPQRRHA